MTKIVIRASRLNIRIDWDYQLILFQPMGDVLVGLQLRIDPKIAHIRLICAEPRSIALQSIQFRPQMEMFASGLP